MIQSVLIVLVASGVGLCIGVCGVAGFLLPIFFLSVCGYTSAQSLFLSFGCFLISGLLGAWNYRKRGELPAGAALPLGLSALAGSLAGALIGQFFVSAHVRTVLYAVVLVSGVMIFVQDYLGRCRQDARQPRLHPGVLVPLGFVTAVICAMSGAGGPVLVMPLLVVLGLPVREAVGAALFDSVFIALPALFVYGAQGLSGALIVPMALAFAAHAAGIMLGSRLAGRIPQQPLKRAIAVFSIAFSVWMLLK